MAISLFGIIKGLLVQREDDRTKQLEVSVNSSATTGTKTTLQASQTANRTVTLPDATDTLAGISAAQSLTNKTIDADQNTITNIENADIKAGAAIDAAKIADGSVSNAEFQLLNGITGGQVVTTSDAQTLTNKTIDGDDNTVQDLALTTLKTVLADANKFIARDASGIPVSVNTVPAGTVVGTSDSQTLTNKTIDADSNTITNIENADIKAGAAIDRSKLASGTASHVLINDGSGVMSSEATLAKSRGGSGQDNSSVNFPASGTLATLAGTEQLTNKDIDGATASNTSRITIPKASKSTLDALTRKQATVVYASDQNALYVDNGTTLLPVGSGSGGSKNYLTTYLNNAGNGDFEYGTTTGWSLGTTGTLTNAFPTGTPTFGSGAAGTLSITTVSSNQLAGSHSLSYASSAATTAGNMLASNAFTIDKEDQAKVLTFSFSYQAFTNPTNANWSGTSSNSFGVAIYDVTNSAWIQPAGCFGMTQSSGVGICTGTFQTSSNGTQYRLVVYNANATTGAVTVYFDDFNVEPQTAPIGAVATSRKSITPTFTGIGSPSSITIWSQRESDCLLITGNFTTGIVTAASATMTFGLDSGTGLSLDTSKVPTGISRVGVMTQAGSTSAFDFVVLADTATPTTLKFGFANGSTGGLSPQNGNAIFTSSTAYSFEIRIPISGWSSNVQMSNDTDTRVVDFVGTQVTQAVTANVTNISFTASKDSHGAWSTNQYVVPVSGDYFVGGSAIVSATATVSVYKNGTSFAANWSTGNPSFATSGAILVPNCNAGDILSIRSNGSVTITGGYLNIFRLSGPSVIAATETVAARYTSTAGQSIPSSSATIIDFGTKDYDSHSAVTTGGSWKFTAPVSGKYSVKSYIQYNGASFTNGNGVTLDLHKNGTFLSRLLLVDVPKTATQTITLSGTDTISLNAGDYIDVRTIQSEGTNRSLTTTAGLVRVSIERIGN